MKKLVSRRELLLASAAVAVPAATGCGTAVNRGETSDAGPPLDAGTPPDASPDDAGAPADSGPVVDASPPPDAVDAPGLPAVGGPGVVIEVSHAGAVVGDVVQEEPVRAIMDRGMRELTGRATEQEAWSALFGPQDVVGIKINPGAYPLAFSQFATVRAIIRGLNAAGVSNEAIVVFDRYGSYLDSVPYATELPAGVRLTSAQAVYADPQTDTEGYDVNEYIELPRVFPGVDPNDPLSRRSHLCKIVSQDVTKVVNVPSLKDHPSAGLTMALKNITYGFVNNVSRTHYAPENWTKDFLPVVASMEKIRKKVVLHIADALIACYNGGPGPIDANFKSFTYSTLLFATDPVALDRIGLKILDEQRAKTGRPPVEECGKALTNYGGLEAFDERQPQYIAAAAALGLGVGDLPSIEHRRYAV
jgi:hypothetical protein